MQSSDPGKWGGAQATKSEVQKSRLRIPARTSTPKDQVRLKLEGSTSESRVDGRIGERVSDLNLSLTSMHILLILYYSKAFLSYTLTVDMFADAAGCLTQCALQPKGLESCLVPYFIPLRNRNKRNQSQQATFPRPPPPVTTTTPSAGASNSQSSLRIRSADMAPCVRMHARTTDSAR